MIDVNKKASLYITESINARTMTGNNSQKKIIKSEIKARQWDAKLLKLYMPHTDQDDQDRADRTLAFINAVIDDLKFDLQYASDLRY